MHSSNVDGSCKKTRSNINAYSPPFSKLVSEVESDEQEQVY